MVALEKINELKMCKIVLNAIKETEKYDKTKNTISVQKLLNYALRRYQMMNSILKPLKDILSSEMDIFSAYFLEGIQGEASINIEYNINDRKDFFTISQYDDDIEVYFSLINDKSKEIIENNKKMIIDIFNDAYGYNFENEYQLLTTSKNFLISGNSNDFNLFYKKSNSLNLGFDLKRLDEDKDIILPSKINGNLTNINFFDEENVINLLNNLKVYEENVPKCFIKVK